MFGSEDTFGVAVLTVFFVLWFGHAYLMVTNPKRWVSWVISMLWKPFGLTVTIADEQKLRKRAWFVGTLYIVVGILGLVLFVSAFPIQSR